MRSISWISSMTHSTEFRLRPSDCTRMVDSTRRKSPTGIELMTSADSVIPISGLLRLFLLTALCAWAALAVPDNVAAAAGATDPTGGQMTPQQRDAQWQASQS